MPEPYDPTRHAYVRKILRLQRRGRIPQGAGLVSVQVRHDEWCPALKPTPGYCACNPTIRWRNQRGQLQEF